jgi:hypothetical protein
MAGIAQAEKHQVLDALRIVAQQQSQELKPVRFWDLTAAENHLRIIVSQQDNVTVTYPRHHPDYGELLSSILMRPVLSLEVFDGDFWRYRLFTNGHEVDRFNPIPEYFGELSKAELHSWHGDAAVVCQHWPNVAQEQIKNYLVRWEECEDGLGYYLNDFSEKAYPEDAYGVGEAEQVSDFMTKLGLTSPWDEKAWLLADEYRFENNN